jgi:glutathione S-transferase
VRLHYTPGSAFARIIRVILRELQLQCQEIEITVFPPSSDYFAVNPLGQVPALETDEGVLFPTGIIIEFLMDQPRSVDTGFANSVRRSQGHWRDDQMLAVILAMGDALGAMKYQGWAGLAPVGENLIGYDPAERHLERVSRTLDWLEARAKNSGFLPGVLSVQDVSLASFILWTEARGPISWRGRPKLEAIVTNCSERASFQQTKPQPWP